MGTIKQNFANNVETGGTFDAQDLTGTIPAANIANSSLSDITTVPPTATGGDLIQSVASDPPAPDFGDVWYNSTEQKIKLKTLGAGSWATGGTLNQARSHFQGGGGNSNSSALAVAGYTGYYTNTESYNGTSWTEVNDLNTGKGFATTSGTQTSAINGGGAAPSSIALAESWNGTSWTEVNDLNQARNQLASAGTDNTSALIFAGYAPPITYAAQTESWNGSSWTEVNDLNTARYVLAGAGTATSALAYGGDSAVPGGYTAETESWNGTSWTEVGDLNTARFGMASTNGSDNTLVLASGGEQPGVGVVTITEQWNGTSWTEVADLSTSRYAIGGAGTTSSAIAFGGNNPGGSSNATEEWTVATPNQSIQGS